MLPSKIAAGSRSAHSSVFTSSAADPSLPVLLVYGTDEADRPDAQSSNLMVVAVEKTLKDLGLQVVCVDVARDLHGPLRAFSPAQCLVMNLAEGQPNQSFYFAAVAKALESHGFAFSGSSGNVLDESQSKIRTKQLLDLHKVSTPRWQVCRRPEDFSFAHLPAIIKPESEHCSIGIGPASIVLDAAQGQQQVAWVLSRFQGGALVEEFIDGPEYIASVWEDDHGQPVVLPLAEIDYTALPDIRQRLCSYDAKWNDETAAYQETQVQCPAQISETLHQRIAQVAAQAFTAVGCRDYARVDLRLRLSDGMPMVLDVNPNCDISPKGEGGFSHAARMAGVEYPQLLLRLLTLTQRRKNRQEAAHLAPPASLVR